MVMVPLRWVVCSMFESTLVINAIMEDHDDDKDLDDDDEDDSW